MELPPGGVILFTRRQGSKVVTEKKMETDILK